jgi:hypothetical protein
LRDEAFLQGDGVGDTFHTNLLAVYSGRSALDAIEIPPNGVKAVTIPLGGLNSSAAAAASSLSAAAAGVGTIDSCEAAHESLDEENLDLEISCRVSKKNQTASSSNSATHGQQGNSAVAGAGTGAILVVRNHGSGAATLDAGWALVVVRRYAL